MFQELSSCPATMEAAKAADCYGLLEGHVVEQADAEQAYTQSKLGGTPTWIRLPRERWPKAWANMRDPVCPLVLALYGHPDAGGYWERHCAAHLRSVGFQDIPNWRSCFWHPRYKVYLNVYVDDFKMAGPKPAMASVVWGTLYSCFKGTPRKRASGGQRRCVVVGSRLKFSTAWTAPAGTRAPGRGRRPRRSADAGGAGDDDLLPRSPSTEGQGDRTGSDRVESRTGRGDFPSGATWGVALGPIRGQDRVSPDQTGGCSGNGPTVVPLKRWRK